jgi:hypothetical protein
MRKSVFVVLAAAALAFTFACNKSPTTPTNPVPDFHGTWSGFYHVDTCTATFVNDDWCPNALGATAPITLTLTQSGSSVSGTLALSTVTGNITGTVSSSGTLAISGTLSATGGHFTISAWSSTMSANNMTGTFTFTVFEDGVAGSATNGCTLTAVTRSQSVKADLQPGVTTSTPADLLSAIGIRK